MERTKRATPGDDAGWSERRRVLVKNFLDSMRRWRQSC